MGCFDAFCTLCGGPLVTGDIWDSLRSPDPQPRGAYWDYNQNLLCDKDLEWLLDVRIIAEWQSKTDQDKHTSVAAEVYYASTFDPCAGPFEATDRNGVTHWCYTFVKGENESGYPGFHFVMHSACLLIARRWMFEEGKTIQDLYNVLCLYDLDQFIGVYLPNRHYGAEWFWGQDWHARQRWEFLVKDPVNIPSMTEYILSKLHLVISEEQKLLEHTLNACGNTCECFSCGLSNARHPVNCFEQGRVSARGPQEQDFYRKQLLSGHLFALQDLDLGMVERRWNEIKDKDWRRLVRDLTYYANFDAGEYDTGVPGKLHDVPIGLKNRIRIVKIMQGIFTGR